MTHRIPHRLPNGQYTRPSLIGSFGLSTLVCPACGGFNPWKVGIEEEPRSCLHCGAAFSTVTITSPPSPTEGGPK